jgi:hypothetical protein
LTFLTLLVMYITDGRPPPNAKSLPSIRPGRPAITSIVTADAPQESPTAPWQAVRDAEELSTFGWIPSRGKEHRVPIRPYIKEGAFGPEAVSAMATAFEDACTALTASARADIAKETIAAKVIELARGGETDPIVLREMVLSEFGLSRVSKQP